MLNTHYSIYNKTIYSADKFNSGAIIGFDNKEVAEQDAKVLGVALSNCPSAQQNISVLLIGEINLIAGEAIQAGDKLIADGKGGVIKANDTHKNAFAVALKSAEINRSIKCFINLSA